MEALAITNGLAVLLFLATHIIETRVRARTRHYEHQARLSEARVTSYVGLLAVAPAALASRGSWELIAARRWTPGWVMAIVESRQASALSRFSAAYAEVSAQGSEKGRRIAGDLFNVVMDARFKAGEPEEDDLLGFREAMAELESQVTEETELSKEAESEIRS